MPGPMIAYCGPAAIPEDFWTRWNSDPLLIAALATLALAVGRGHSSDARAGWSAIALMLVVFVSPLCALSSALFSARVLHHVLLIAAVAPLLAVAFPQRRAGSPPRGGSRALSPPAPVCCPTCSRDRGAGRQGTAAASGARAVRAGLVRRASGWAVQVRCKRRRTQ